MTDQVQKEGLWLVDKPVGITSFGLVAKLRRQTGIRKIGHAGTLDPMASGLMLLLVGKDWTRQADRFIKQDKVYQVEMKLGATSSTGDAEGEIVAVSDARPSMLAVKRTLAQFTGRLEQVPPAHSAIKVNGVRAYKLARQGKRPDLKPRPVEVYAIENVTYDYPVLRFEAHVSSGTYIRSLVSDVGQALGCGAYLSSLRRTRIGQYSVSRAVKLD